MNQRIATVAALTIIGAAALGLETLAVTGVARGAGQWLGSSEALAVGRAGRIAAESLGRTAADHAWRIAFDATFGVVRGLSAVCAATGSGTRAIPAVAPEPEIRIIRVWEGVDANADAGLDPCCENAKADRTSS